jgi:hypothetical protein
MTAKVEETSTIIKWLLHVAFTLETSPKEQSIIDTNAEKQPT